jgi:hypothetical protein
MMSVPPPKPPLIPIIVGDRCCGFLYRRRGAFEAFTIDEKSAGIFATEHEAIAALFDPKGQIDHEAGAS